MTVHVIHIERAPIVGNVVYIGRNAKYGNTIYGNPFILFRDGDRSIVVAKYRRWIGNVLCVNPDIFEAFARLIFLASHDDLYLACHCAPDLCHGDIIKEYIEAALATEFKDDRSKTNA